MCYVHNQCYDISCATLYLTDFDKLWCERLAIVGNHNPVPRKFRTVTNNCMKDVGPC